MAKWSRNKNSIINNKSLIIILFLASFLRLWKLNAVPPAPSLDEVSIGWNAYSILETGADEYGNRLPVLLRAYDDWRPALYVYLVIPFVKLFGLNVVSIRLPAVILSILTVLATYFLIIELFSRKNIKTLKHKNKKSNIQYPISNIALFTAGFLSISPWHIYISRLGHEANAGLVFLIFAVLFFLRKRIILSAVLFTFSFMAYQSEKIIVPIIVGALLILYWNRIKKNLSRTILAGLIGLIIISPLLLSLAQGDALARFAGTNTFRPGANWAPLQKQKELYRQAVEENNLFGRIYHSRKILPLKIFVSGYLAHFKPQWLFTNGGEDLHKVPNLGLLYIWEASFILLGIFSMGRWIWKRQVNRKTAVLLAVWFLSAPLPAAITTEAPHAMRSYTILPVWQILGAMGIFSFYRLYITITKRFRYITKYRKYWLKALAVLVFLISLAQLSINYFVIFPREQSDSFQYALGPAVEYALKQEDKYKKIVFSNKDNLYQSYMFFLYYSRYDPELYQQQGGTVSGGYAETHSFGKYEFRPIDWPREKNGDDTLYIGNFDEIPVKGLSRFNYLNGEPAVTIAKKDTHVR